MKHLTWLLLALFCTVLVQVQPVDGLVPKAAGCSRCHPGMCGMPGCCCPPSAAAPGIFSLGQSGCGTDWSGARCAQPVRRVAEKFYALFLEPIAVRRALPASAGAAPAAYGPLFKAHCSFLI